VRHDDAVPTDLGDLLSSARVFSIPLRTRFRGITVREGVLLDGPAGWSEFAPFRDYDDAACVPWLRAAIDSASRNWPDPVRSRVPVNVTVPVVDAAAAATLVTESGCRTAKLKVADPRSTLADDCARAAAVRDALGPDGRIRVDANAVWTVPEAIEAIGALDAAAAGLEYVEQPCRTVDELATVRAAVGVPIAADESIRLAGDPEMVALAGAADIAVIKVAQTCGLPVVVSSALDTSVGMAAGLALAGALPELPYACGLATASLLTGDVTTRSGRPTDGYLPVPLYAPAPSPELLERWAADPATSSYWLDRLRRVAALV
jgi:O-succinylbenzoate synthase